MSTIYNPMDRVTDDNRVIPAIQNRCEATLHSRDHLVEDRYTAIADAVRQVDEPIGAAAGEMVGKLLLMLGQKMNRKVLTVLNRRERLGATIEASQELRRLK